MNSPKLEEDKKPTTPKDVLPFGHRSLIESSRPAPDPFRMDPPRLGDGRICHITTQVLGREALFAPEGDAGAGGGGTGGSTGGGEGDPPPEKTFTQADVDRMIGQRVGEATKKFAGFEDFKARAAKAEEYEAELAKLREENELKGKSADEQQRIQAERAAKRLDQERAEAATKMSALEQRAETAEKNLRDYKVASELGSALDGARVLSAARDKAVRSFREDADVELDEKLNVVGITYGGVAYKTASEAAEAFLKDNKFFASGVVPSGGGTKPPNGGGMPGGSDPLKQTAEENFAAGLSQPPKPAPSFGA